MGRCRDGDQRSGHSPGDAIAIDSATLRRWIQETPARRVVWSQLESEAELVYLVGGSVRDILLGRATYDLDFATEASAMALAARVAHATRGAYVPLDEERNVARVVVRSGHGYEHFDFAALRADGIIADLEERDYTVNAIALAVGPSPSTLIDPTRGREDLRAGMLRATHPGVFADDPLRVLRGIRLCGSLGFCLTPDTRALLREWAHALASVSGERVREELYQILGLADAASALGQAQELGVVDAVLPEAVQTSSAWRAGRDALRLLEGWAGFSTGEGCPCPEAGGMPWAEHRASLLRLWNQELSRGRHRWPTLKLACLVPERAQVSGLWRRLRLSAQEGRFLDRALWSASESSLWDSPEPLAALAIHRYFVASGDAGVDGAVLAWARRAAHASKERRAGVADGMVAKVRRVLTAWFCHPGTIISPPQLLSGRDVMTILGLEQGPEVGRVLGDLREAQVLGAVSTSQEARDWLLQRNHVPPDGVNGKEALDAPVTEGPI